jgi:hypothetical protein
MSQELNGAAIRVVPALAAKDLRPMISHLQTGHEERLWVRLWSPKIRRAPNAQARLGPILELGNPRRAYLGCLPALSSRSGTANDMASEM